MLTHVKVNAAMEIDERRRPLEGRWIRIRADGTKVDLRINTVPTLFGEDMAIRLLVRDAELQKLESLGMSRVQVAELLAMLNSPSGLLLVTGPTGAGKTTTLYTCLDYLNNGQRKINTIEDPIEYALPGVRQSQVNLRVSIDFPELLRAVLRQSPDVIMIGEIRDPVTAQTAVRAASSGHLVLATLHAPVAGAAVQSMLAYGVSPYFLANSLRGVVAQRLVRTLCPSCRQPFDVADVPQMFQEIVPLLEEGERPALFAAVGCEACKFEGYKRRTGVFEVMSVGPALRDGIMRSLTAKQLEEIAVREGMLTFRTVSLLKVARGVTNTEEVLRVVPAEFMGGEEEYTPAS
jgi:type II secretory ATPase GspE/PulE/Tfp pilus assembly ATPase PilB-like protein